MSRMKPAERESEPYPIGCFPIDVAGVRTAEGRVRLYVGVARTSRFAFVHS